ncbi:hypothetical protein CRG98_001237 [Punica granatum]|uniref:Uncharacterized protein n=1 Tax=Punica granatum TaxID=22663 RepID=A0A2I0LCG5_PUNGR|nr:hypothetical protein CRG98_001237 [Punica granatum]
MHPRGITAAVKEEISRHGGLGYGTMRGRVPSTPKGLLLSCAVERLSARDHLVTGESEGRGEPLECDGMTRRGRGKKWRAEDPGWLWKSVSVMFLLPAETARAKSGSGTRLGTEKVPRDPILDDSGSACWKFQMPKLTPEIDSGGQEKSRKKLEARLVVRLIFVVRLNDELSIKCSGDPGTRKPILLRLDNRGEVVHFCRLFEPLRDVPLVSACFVLWAERFTRQPRLEIDNRRRPRNP